MSTRHIPQYPIHWIRVRRNIHFAQAKNCLLYIQIGTLGIFIGTGTRPKGYGARLELFTPSKRFRVHRGSWYEMNYRERKAYLAKKAQRGATK